jgi:hypothetical protein
MPSTEAAPLSSPTARHREAVLKRRLPQVDCRGLLDPDRDGPRPQPLWIAAHDSGPEELQQCRTKLAPDLRLLAGHTPRLTDPQ